MGLVIVVAPGGLARSFNGALMETLRLRFRNTDMARDLSEAQRLTELHGGTLAIDSAIGAGTAVSVCLPTSRIIDRDSGTGEGGAAPIA